MRKVAIIYRIVPQYRRKFYEMLRDRLKDLGIELLLIYGQPSRRDAMKMDYVEIPWGIKVRSRIWELGSRELYWQPILGYLRGVDLVIVEQASKLLVNYVLVLQNLAGIRKVAFWGHGKNLQETSASPIGEWIKSRISILVHWWFAYNDLSARIVRSLGFPEERITSVQNAIDTHRLVQARMRLTKEDISSTLRDLGSRSGNICIYSSGMYPEKRLGFLLEALEFIRHEIPDFEMIFIGSGPDAQVVSDAARAAPWIHYLGPKFDDEKVPYFAVSKLFLMPGLVGLGVLDAFALETPLVTTRVPLHSPEIQYLVDGVNGVMVEAAEDPEAYAEAVINLLRNDEVRISLIEGCRSAREIYTLEAMVERFANGICGAIEWKNL